ncbi:MAG: polysaccharide biosynthesis/export family protein [Candidatus Omnitrophota bacterium]
MDGRLTITEVAQFVGVTPRTIMRWEKSGKIKRSRRDWRGWRFYLKEDLEGIKKFYESTYEYEEVSRVSANLAKTTVSVLIILASSFSLPIYTCAQTECAVAATANTAKTASGIKETGTTVDINLANLPSAQQPLESITESSKYTLGPDDAIEIEVRKHAEFSGNYTITAEGKIEYKFVGDVLVSGLTKKQLEDRLSGILSEYIINPVVNVSITSCLSKVYYVVGEVGRPGKFYMKGNTIPILEALIASGLPTQSSATRKCRLITPRSKGKVKIRYINVYELLYGGDMRQNIDMMPGEILYIPSTVVSKVIRIISPVTNAVSEAAGSAVQGAGVAAVAL